MGVKQTLADLVYSLRTQSPRLSFHECIDFLASESAYFRGLEYLIWSPTRSQSVSGHHIIIRFKTYLENGILFTAGSKGDFLILEVYKGSLRMSINLGGGMN